MAKAKKPASGNKSTSAASKKDAATDGSTVKSTDAVSAKTDSAAKADAGKTVAPVKSGTDAPKPADAKAADAGKSAETSKTPDAAKPKDTAVTASEAKKSETTSSVPKTKPSAAGDGKPVTPTSTSKSTPAAAKETIAAKTTGAKDATPAKIETSKLDVAKPAPVTTSTSRQESTPQRSVFWPLVLGGVVAGGLGFVAAEMNVLNTRVANDDLRDAVAAQDTRIEELETAEVAEPAAPADLSGVEGSVGALQGSIAAIEETVLEIETRLATLEARPAVAAGDNDDGAAQAYAEELAALQSSVETQQSEIQRLLENAISVEEATASAAERAALQAALTKVTTAIASGAPFEEAVETLNESGTADVPAALTAVAGEGVPTLLTLQTDFPDTARIALAASRASGEEETGGGLGSFLQRQLGARSVVPREGTDTDAVLSRAEVAVREGRVAEAIAEIETLPAAAKDAMADWLAAARTRADAEAAVQDLSQSLTAN